MPRTRDQIRAADAWAAVTAWGANSDKRNLCEKLPAMLITNGLPATWAFLCAKPDRIELAQTVLRYLQQPYVPSVIRNMAANYQKADDAYRGWNLSMSIDLRTLTDEIIAYSIWLKRAAEILIPPPGDQQ
jgi:CRISPR type III-B/RAMP module-associated protein Cmr5